MKKKNIKPLEIKKEQKKSPNESIKIDDQNPLNPSNENLSSNIIKSSTSNDFLNKKKKQVIFKEFPGFFFKKFNLTSYKKERSDSRERSKSPEIKRKPHHKKGNGIPDDLLMRLKYISKIINTRNFIKYYQNKPKGRNVKFEDIFDYIMNYTKEHNELESVLLVYYFICNDIKYYSKESLNHLKEKLKNKSEYIIFNDTQFFEEGYIPKPNELYLKGIALNPSFFTNIFEFFLKKMQIKYKHIEGYCKLMEINDTNKKNLQKKLKQRLFYNNNNISQRVKSSSSLKDIQTLPEFTINHCWNAVYMKGEWYFIDTFFGSGGFIKDSPTPPTPSPRFAKLRGEQNFFNFYYFMTPPEYLISTHRPIEDRWQFLKKTVTFPQFYYKKLIHFGDFYYGVSLYDIELLTHKYPYIEVNKNDKLEIKLRLREFILEGELYTPNLLSRIGEIKIFFDDDNKIYTFEPQFPNIGEYILRITSRPIITNELVYTPLFDYKIRVKNPDSYLYFEKYKLIKKENNKLKEKNNENTNNIFLPKLNNNTSFRIQPKIINDYSKILPSKTNKVICYDDRNFYLIEPRTKILRKGIKFKFKIKIKGTSNVSLLDGNHWMPLKRTEEDIYEGIKEIETDNVSICCLRNKNVFTEVIKFMIHKDRSILSRSFFPKVNKLKRNMTKINIKNNNNLSISKQK